MLPITCKLESDANEPTLLTCVCEYVHPCASRPAAHPRTAETRDQLKGGPINEDSVGPMLTTAEGRQRKRKASCVLLLQVGRGEGRQKNVRVCGLPICAASRCNCYLHDLIRCGIDWSLSVPPCRAQCSSSGGTVTRVKVQFVALSVQALG